MQIKQILQQAATERGCPVGYCGLSQHLAATELSEYLQPVRTTVPLPGFPYFSTVVRYRLTKAGAEFLQQNRGTSDSSSAIVTGR